MLLLSSCVTTHAYTTITSTRATEGDAVPSEEERARALQIAHTVAREHRLEASGSGTRLPAYFGDGTVWIEVWPREEPARFEFQIVEFDTYPPTTRTSEIHLTFQAEIERQLPGFQTDSESRPGSQPSGFFYWLMSRL